MATYPISPLRNICESVEYGYTASATTEPVGPRFLRITDIVPERLDWEAVPFCEIESNKLSKHRLRTGDIVIARTGATTGWAKYIKDPPEAVFASYLVRIRPSSSVDARFVGFVIESSAYKDFIHQHMSGAAQPNANAQVLTSYEIPLPPLPIQRRIAGILAAYDDLIENSQRRIRLLETMARSLYREWFVHFRFPGHEDHPRVASALGEIPAGWEVGRLADLMILQRGFDLPKGARVEGNVPIYAATGVTGFHNEAKAKAPGVVTGRSGTIGDVLYVQEDFWPLNTALWVKEFPKSESLYAYYVLSSLDLKQFNSGAAVPTLNRNDIHSLDVLIPPRPIQQRFQEVAAAMLYQARTLGLQIQNLRRTRDLLLPRLLAGQVELEAVA